MRMAVTTPEFEKHLSSLLAEREKWRRCAWCGWDDGRRRMGLRDKLCNRCKEWRRKENLALKWQGKNPRRLGSDEGLRVYEYAIQ